MQLHCRTFHVGSWFTAEFVVMYLWCAVFQARMRNFWKFSKAALNLAVLILPGMTGCPTVMGQRLRPRPELLMCLKEMLVSSTDGTSVGEAGSHCGGLCLPRAH